MRTVPCSTCGTIVVGGNRISYCEPCRLLKKKQKAKLDYQKHKSKRDRQIKAWHMKQGPEYDRARRLRYIAKDPEGAKARNRKAALAYHYRNRERENAKHRNYMLRKKFGISFTEYDQISEAQGHKCFLCDSKCISGRRLAVDHDHSTGKVRSLLCSRCNNGIGCFLDNPELMERAAQYVRSHREVGVSA